MGIFNFQICHFYYKFQIIKKLLSNLMSAELVKLNTDDSQSFLDRPSSLISHFFISRLTWSFAFPILLIAAYIFGKRAIQKNIIIDNSLKERLENVEISKKYLKKRIELWDTTFYFFRTILFTVLGLIITYTSMYYFKPEYIDFLIPFINKLFVHVIILLVTFLFLMVKYTKYKKGCCQQSLNEIDAENVELAAKIVSKMGPELKKLLTSSLIASKKEKNFLPECKKEFCQIQKRLYELELMRHKVFVERVATFPWCSACSHSFYFQDVSKQKEINSEKVVEKQQINEEKIKKEENKENQEKINEDSCLSENVLIKKENDIKCLDQCVKRYFNFAIEIGNEFKQNLEEINFLKKALEELQKRKKK